MIINVIGPPGSGKTTYIQTHHGFAPPMTPIDGNVFQHFVDNDVFEHTGLNPTINSYLKATDRNITTIWFQTSTSLCLFRIARDFLAQRTNLRQTWSRLKILGYYHRNHSAIYLPEHRRGHHLHIIRTRCRVWECIRRRR